MRSIIFRWSHSYDVRYLCECMYMRYLCIEMYMHVCDLDRDQAYPQASSLLDAGINCYIPGLDVQPLLRHYGRLHGLPKAGTVALIINMSLVL